MEEKMTEGKSKKNRKSKDLKGDKKGICLLSLSRSPAFFPFPLASQESESDLGLVLHLREVMRSREKKTK